MDREAPACFDSYLGGNQEIRSSINVHEFCKNRMDEILMLTESLKDSPFRGQVFQRLPKHMRRRQMSHYIKRLPKQLRNVSALSTKEDNIPPKRSSRFYRRRPKSLLLEYNRRQRKHIWLETHIWHARRFHMTSKWGYFLPQKPANKSFRACYRASTQHCFLSDMSYYNVIELSGSESRLLQGLQQCVSVTCGLTFAAKMFMNGSREGSVVLYHPQSFPYHVIGKVTFLWKPIEKEDRDRKIWIFTHPSLHNEIISVFKNVFNLSEVKDVETKDEVISSGDSVEENIIQKAEQNGGELKLMKILHHQTPNYTTNDGTVTMMLLKDTLNRFRLTGPLSLVVLAKAFNVNTNDPTNYESSDVEIMPAEKSQIELKNPMKRTCSDSDQDESSKSVKKFKNVNEGGIRMCENENKNSLWWCKFYKNEFRIRCQESQKSFYKNLSTFVNPTDLPPSMIFSIIVTDPRLTIPSKRIKCTPQVQEMRSELLETCDSSLSYSPLWNREVRDEVSRTKITTSEINEIRGRLVVPGSDVGNYLPESKRIRVPLIVIQRSGASAGKSASFGNIGLASGFDIIVPSGWAMPVWLSLIYRGARPGGLRDAESMQLESRNMSDFFQPDSAAGETENLERCEKLKLLYFKRPPSKRPNFAKFGVDSPFYFPWKTLIKDWYQAAGNKVPGLLGNEVKFYVLRDKMKLSEISDIMKNMKALTSRSKAQFKHSFQESEMDCLVPVCVESCGKGTPKEFAMLCLPFKEDVTNFTTNRICPVENPHVDENEQEKKMLKLEHAKFVRSMKRKRRINRKKRSEEQKKLLFQEVEGRIPGVKLETLEVTSLQNRLEEYKKKIQDLWLKRAENLDSVINSSSKKIVGFVVAGGFSHVKACGLGLGYVTLRGLLYWLKTCRDEGIQPLVLFRNTNNIKYRFCKMTVCTDCE